MQTEMIRAEGGFKEYRILGIDANGLTISTSIDVFKTTSGSWQFVWSGMDGVASCELQASHNGTEWDTIVGSEFSTVGAAGSTGGMKAQIPGGWVRAVVTSAATDGVIDLYMNCKEDNEG